MKNALSSIPGPRSSRTEKLANEGARTEVVYTFKVLSRPLEAGPRTVLFRRVGDGEAIEIRAETSAPNLLATLPDFLEAALDLRRRLTDAAPARAAAEDSLAARLAEEAGRLRVLADDGDVPARRARRAQQRLREAMLVRDIAAEAITCALDRDHAEAVAETAASLPSPAGVAAALERLARRIDEALEDSRDASFLLAWELDAAYAFELRRQAALLVAEEELASSAPPSSREDPRAGHGILRLLGAAFRARGGSPLPRPVEDAIEAAPSGVAVAERGILRSLL
jgi:hypothetical protein